MAGHGSEKGVHTVDLMMLPSGVYQYILVWHKQEK
jgi:hypothetical protein